MANLRFLDDASEIELFQELKRLETEGTDPFLGYCLNVSNGDISEQKFSSVDHAVFVGLLGKQWFGKDYQIYRMVNGEKEVLFPADN